MINCIICNRIYLAGINVFNENGMRAGPFSTIDFGRDSDDASYLAGAEDVDPTLESGVFFEKEFDPFSFLWTARYAILNEGHGGFVSDAELSYRMVIKPGFYGTVSGTVSWASQDYMISYFGVSPNHSARSGLRGYEPDAGFKDFEGSNVDAFIKNNIARIKYDFEYEYFYTELYLMLYSAINIGRKDIVDNF